MVGEEGLEPSRGFAPADFESAVSAISPLPQGLREINKRETSLSIHLGFWHSSKLAAPRFMESTLGRWMSKGIGDGEL